jgi:hypothetical protein
MTGGGCQVINPIAVDIPQPTEAVSKSIATVYNACKSSLSAGDLLMCFDRAVGVEEQEPDGAGVRTSIVI